MRRAAQIITIAFVLLTAGCVRLPPGIEPVTEFELNRYLGTWYEIARLDHPFERGLQQVTAEYTLRDDGSVRVSNRGYSPEEDRWKQAEGRARLARSPEEGFLKVSFFGPFYGSYVIFELDQEDYSYAFVCGPNRSYLWLLSRTPTVPPHVFERFLSRAGSLGFDTSQLIRVTH